MKSLAWMRDVLADRRIKPDTRVLVMFIGSRPKGWAYSLDALCDVTGRGREAVKGMVREAKERGWITVTSKRDRSGRITGSTVVLHDNPKPVRGVGVVSKRRGRRVEMPPAGDGCTVGWYVKPAGPEGGKTTRYIDIYDKSLNDEGPSQGIGGGKVTAFRRGKA